MTTPDQSREALAKWMIEHSFATGHGDTLEGLLGELAWQVEELRGTASPATVAGAAPTNAESVLAAEIIKQLENRGYMDLQFNREDAQAARELIAEMLVEALDIHTEDVWRFTRQVERHLAQPESADSRLTTLLTGLRGLREAAEWVIEWEDDYRKLNNLGRNPPMVFINLAKQVAALDTLVRTVEGK